MDRRIRLTTRIAALAPTLVSLTACTSGFQILDAPARGDFLQNKRVFSTPLISSNSQQGSISGNTTAPTETDSRNGTIGGNTIESNAPLRIDARFRRECSDAITSETGSNLLSARQLVLEVYRKDYSTYNSNLKMNGGSIDPVCVDRRDWKSTFSPSFDRLTADLDCRLAAGDYMAFLRDPNATRVTNRSIEIARFDFSIRVIAGIKSLQMNTDYRNFLLLDYNDTSNHLEIPAQHPELCDGTNNSPLAIQFSDAGSAIDLSAPEQGIWFDIAGANALPVPHTPYLISWTNSPSLKFIVKPNAQGEVLGIDEMFGNNTRGPDGKFADDGFNALAKFDGKDQDGNLSVAAPDGLITAEDTVYESLRLWSDLNRDGRSQSEELMTLRDADISIIDLNFDARFYEVDRYGNEVKYKSVAYSRSGQPRLVFDIWFK